MFHPDLLAQMIHLEHAERLRDAERVRRLRHRGAGRRLVGRGGRFRDSTGRAGPARVH